MDVDEANSPGVLTAKSAPELARKFVASDAQESSYDFTLSKFLDTPCLSLATSVAIEYIYVNEEVPSNYLAMWEPLQATRGLLRAFSNAIQPWVLFDLSDSGALSLSVIVIRRYPHIAASCACRSTF